MPKVIGQTSGGKAVVVRVDDAGQLQVDVVSIAAGANLIGRVDARDGDKIWSYKGLLSDPESAITPSAGTYSLTFDVVPAGEFWQVNSFSAWHTDGTARDIIFYLRDDVAMRRLEKVKNVSAYSPVLFGGTIRMTEGMYLRLQFVNIASGVDVRGYANGYKMSI